MSDILQILIELTEMDHAAAETQKQIERYPGMLVDLGKAVAAREKAVADNRAALDAAKLARSAAEKDALAMRDKIAKLEKQQANVKTAQQAEAMTHEIDGLRARIDERETEGLEHLMKEEELAEGVKKAAAMLEKTRAESDAERERIAEQTEEKTGRLERLRIERGTWLAKLEPDWRAKYENLHLRHPGSALAPLEGQSCGGCRWALTNNAISKARAHSLEAVCEHCGRMLYAK